MARETLDGVRFPTRLSNTCFFLHELLQVFSTHLSFDLDLSRTQIRTMLQRHEFDGDRETSDFGNVRANSLSK